MLPQWVYVLLTLMARLGRSERDAQLQFLRLQIELLCRKLPGNRVILAAEDRQRLLRAGAAMGHAVDDVLEIVTVKTYRRWIREQQAGQAPGQVGRPKRVSRWLQGLILRLGSPSRGRVIPTEIGRRPTF